MSYLRWRGDLTFEDSPFNEVDNLILSYLSYLDFTNIVTGKSPQQSISLKEVAKNFFKKDHKSAIVETQVLQMAANTKRYGEARVWGYEDIIDSKREMTQFAAIHVMLPDGTEYISFRGTDNSIVGWREDFRLSYEIVPAQKRAVEYLERTIEKSASHTYRIGGHSKGGNLALYGAMMSSDTIQGQIMEIYMNDSPGLCLAMIEKEQYKKIADKIIKIIPEFSIIGRLFETKKPNRFVKSSADGVLQHDAITWEVEGAEFIAADRISDKCTMYNEIFDKWIESADMEQRRVFTRDFFDALEAGGAKTIMEVMSGGANGFEAILMAMIKSEKKSKIVVGKLLKSFFKGICHIDYLKLLKEKKMLQGFGLFIVGTIFVVLPKFALQIIGTVFFLWLFVFSVLRLVHYREQYQNGEPVEKVKILFYGAIAGVEFLCIIKNNIIVLSSNLVLAIFFLFRAYKRAKESASLRVVKEKLFFLPLLDAVLTVCFGIVSFSAKDTVRPEYLIVAGSYLVLVGITGIVKAMYEIVEKNEN